MQTEETNNGFFSKFKNIFGTTAKEEITTAETNEVLVAEVPVTEPVKQTETYMRASMVSDESVTEREIGIRTVEVSAPKVNLPVAKDLDIRFAQNFSAAGGKFLFCETMREAVSVLNMMKFEHGWQYLFAWENEIKDAFTENNFQKGAIGFTIENSDVAVSLADCLIAEDGTILLNPKQASRRRLPCFPKTHIIITDIAHLATNEAEALERFYQNNKGELPSIIKLGSCNGNGHLYDKQRLILNAEGPEDVYVILVDEIIPVSLRP